MCGKGSRSEEEDSCTALFPLFNSIKGAVDSIKYTTPEKWTHAGPLLYWTMSLIWLAWSQKWCPHLEVPLQSCNLCLIWGWGARAPIKIQNYSCFGGPRGHNTFSIYMEIENCGHSYMHTLANLGLCATDHYCRHFFQ